MRPQSLSLRAQAVAWLAQREHSERELRRKLLRRLTHPRDTVPPLHRVSGPSATRPAEHDDVSTQSFSADPGFESGPAPIELSEAQSQVDAVIQWVIERGYLNESRFVASRVHVREAKLGLARIQQELGQHGLNLPAEMAQALRASEHERAAALWQRRFGLPPADLKEAARQTRYLVARGFSGDVVRALVRVAGRSDRAPPHTDGD
jgi:regulatory protein